MLRGIPVAWADATTGSDVLRMSAIGGLTSRRYRISSGRQKELRSRGQGSTAGICMERVAQPVQIEEATQLALHTLGSLEIHCGGMARKAPSSSKSSRVSSQALPSFNRSRGLIRTVIISRRVRLSVLECQIGKPITSTVCTKALNFPVLRHKLLNAIQRLTYSRHLNPIILVLADCCLEIQEKPAHGPARKSADGLQAALRHRFCRC